MTIAKQGYFGIYKEKQNSTIYMYNWATKKRKYTDSQIKSIWLEWLIFLVSLLTKLWDFVLTCFSERSFIII